MTVFKHTYWFKHTGGVLPTDYNLTAEVVPPSILAYIAYLTGYHTQVLSECVKYKMACFKKGWNCRFVHSSIE